jgi:hypothetical protein
LKEDCWLGCGIFDDKALKKSSMNVTLASNVTSNVTLPNFHSKILQLSLKLSQVSHHQNHKNLSLKKPTSCHPTGSFPNCSEIPLLVLFQISFSFPNQQKTIFNQHELPLKTATFGSQNHIFSSSTHFFL